MKKILSVAVACGLAVAITAPLKADTIVVLKWSLPVTSTQYEVENVSATATDVNDANHDGKPYARKVVNFTETRANYHVHNITTGEVVTIDYYTWYKSTTPIKRYIVDPVEAEPGWLARVYFYRTATASTAPTYNYVAADDWRELYGGPNDPNGATNLFTYYQGWRNLFRGAQPITTVIAAKINPPAPAIKVLLPSGATGLHQGFLEQTFFPGAPGSISASPSNKRYTVEKGTSTLSYDSVLTGKANAPLAANVHVFNYDGAEVFPGTLAYGVKAVRDTLEALGYEIDTEFDEGP